METGKPFRHAGILRPTVPHLDRVLFSNSDLTLSVEFEVEDVSLCTIEDVSLCTVEHSRAYLQYEVV